MMKEGAGADVFSLSSRNPAGLAQAGVRVGSAGQAAAGGPVPAGAWTHLAATYDGAVLRLYVNGALAASTNAAGSIATSAGALRVGGNAIAGEYFSGLIDEV